MEETGAMVTIERPEVATGSRPLKVERAYDELKRMIVTLALAPGTHIDERELMATLNIGRTPLREAMLRLSHERLIVHSPRRGAWVSELSITDLQQMLEARTMIDALIARRAAERVTPADISALEAVLESAHAAVEARDNEYLVNLDFRFHVHIAELCGNGYYAAFSERVNSSMLRYWHLSGRNAQTIPTWERNHHELLHAVAGGDPDIAELQARKHVLGLRDLLRGLLG
jgi:DNA-binding GntR family transcriptional regulator